jgi:acyl-CoA thioesterase-1
MIRALCFICLLVIALPALADAPVVVALGDSITIGSGVKPEESYPAQLQTMLREKTGLADLTVVNAGIGGHTAGQGLARLDKDVLACKPNFVLLGFGMNDSVMVAADKPRVTPEQFGETLTQMVQRLQAAGAKVLLAPVTPVLEEYYFERHPVEWYSEGLKPQLARYTAVICKVAKDTGSIVIDLSKLDPAVHIRTPENAKARDGVHPTPEGYTVMATAYCDKLVPLLKQQ